MSSGADRSGQFMLDVWNFDPNARVVGDGSLRASIPREEVGAFRAFLNERGWELVGQQAAPGGGRLFCKAKPKPKERNYRVRLERVPEGGRWTIMVRARTPKGARAEARRRHPGAVPISARAY